MPFLLKKSSSLLVSCWAFEFAFTMVICQQCGDKGFSNALVYCVNCLEFAVHRYCLEPVTFDEFVYWVCDDCEVEVRQHFSSLNSKPIQLENGGEIKHVEPGFKEKLSKRRKTDIMVLDSADLICEGVPSEQLYKAHTGIQKTENALLASDCSPLEVSACGGASPMAKSEEEVGSQLHQSSDDDFLRKMKTKKKNVGEFSSEILMPRLEYSTEELNLGDHDDSAKLEKKRASSLEAENKKKHKKRKKTTKKNKDSVLLPENIVQRIGYSPSEQPCELFIENVQSESKKSMKLENKNASLLDAKMEHGGQESYDENAGLETISTSNELVELTPLNKTNKKKRVVNNLSTDFQGITPAENPRFGPDHQSNNATLTNFELAQPLADPIWRGSFNVLNGEYDEFEGMVAHLSKKACQKAYEEARLFPTLLDLEMHPKLDVWPKSFARSEPSDDSIALYFFPANKRYERMFDHLVEQMMNNELAMRAILENAELLIFTSRELPLNIWRFQGKYYLWGVFRGKQCPAAQPLRNNVGAKEDA